MVGAMAKKYGSFRQCVYVCAQYGVRLYLILLLYLCMNAIMIGVFELSNVNPALDRTYMHLEHRILNYISKWNCTFRTTHETKIATKPATYEYI